MNSTPVFLPPPKECVLNPDFFKSTGTHVFFQSNAAPGLLRAAEIVRDALQSPHHALELTAARGRSENVLAATIEIDAHAIGRSEGYRLSITSERVSLIANDAAGAFYGAMTLRQLARQGEIPCLQITDWPDYRHRGVMLDVSRDRVPTMAALYELLDLLAEWKINQFQLYTEHTFAYRDHSTVWKNASPFTGEEILRLDAFCRERHIELVPNQNSFGHLERWLQHPEYAKLAEAPDGFIDPWGNARGAYSLCPLDENSIALVSGLYDELLPHFSSGQFNVGCDETFDLGHGRSKSACEARGAGRVYLDFLLQIHERVKKHGRAMQFWGDIILHHPELISELPKNSVALNWGYEANHPFEAEGEKFSRAGIPFYVCPGTSAWNSIAGRTDNAVENILNAARSGLANGAAGLLNTEWGDNGHWQSMPAAYLGYACGAAAAWNSAATRALDLPRALSVHAFLDASGTLGQAFFDLGNAYKLASGPVPNNSMLALILQRPETPTAHARAMGLSNEGLDATAELIEITLATLSNSTSRRADAELIHAEFRNAAALMLHACNLGRARLNHESGDISALPALEKKKLASELEPVIAEYRRLWLARSRPGGLDDSAGRIQKLVNLYRA